MSFERFDVLTRDQQASTASGRSVVSSVDSSTAAPAASKVNFKARVLAALVKYENSLPKEGTWAKSFESNPLFKPFTKAKGRHRVAEYRTFVDGFENDQDSTKNLLLAVCQDVFPAYGSSETRLGSGIGGSNTLRELLEVALYQQLGITHNDIRDALLEASRRVTYTATAWSGSVATPTIAEAAAKGDLVRQAIVGVFPELASRDKQTVEMKKIQ